MQAILHIHVQIHPYTHKHASTHRYTCRLLLVPQKELRTWETHLASYFSSLSFSSLSLSSFPHPPFSFTSFSSFFFLPSFLSSFLFLLFSTSHQKLNIFPSPFFRKDQWRGEQLTMLLACLGLLGHMCLSGRAGGRHENDPVPAGCLQALRPRASPGGSPECPCGHPAQEGTHTQLCAHLAAGAVGAGLLS